MPPLPALICNSSHSFLTMPPANHSTPSSTVLSSHNVSSSPVLTMFPIQHSQCSQSLTIHTTLSAHNSPNYSLPSVLTIFTLILSSHNILNAHSPHYSQYSKLLLITLSTHTTSNHSHTSVLTILPVSWQ